MPKRSNETILYPELISLGVNERRALVWAEAVTPVEVVILFTAAAMSLPVDPTVMLAVSVPT